MPRLRIFDIGDADGRPYFTMEFVEGGSLAQRQDVIDQITRLGLNDFSDIGRPRRCTLARLGAIDLRAQTQIPSVLRSDTPTLAVDRRVRRRA
jgi:hypothetical protein